MVNVQITPPPLSSLSMADLLCTIVMLCRGVDTNGKPFWAYMCIKPSMAQAFKEAREKGNFHLEDYGTILEMGEGEDVPPEMRQQMERDYGVNHHYQEDLLKVVEDILLKDAI